MKTAALLTLLTSGLGWAQGPAAAPKAPAGRPAGAAARTYKDLKYPPLREVKIPDVPSFTLPNGMKLYLLENHELPLISGFALARTGNLFDPPDKVGLAGITGSVMRTGGTKSKTGDQLDQELENIAASVESSIGETSGRVGFSCLKENVDQVLAVFKDVLTNPEFRQDKIDLAKTQARGGIARQNDDAGDIANRKFNEIVYGKNPYGWEQTYDHVEAIQRADLQAFYQRYFFPANMVLAVQGDFSAAEMKAKLEKLFADWTAKQAPVPPFPKLEAKAQPGIQFASKDDVTQSFLRIGHLGGTLRDKDYPALSIMDSILGGSFSSRLFKKVRTELGYAYNIGANWGANYSHPGLFEISGSVNADKTAEAIQAVLGEVNRIRMAEVTTEELESAKSTVLNSFVFNFDSPSKTLGRLVNYEYFGYPRDFIQQYQKAVAAVTKADILRVAKQYLKPEEFTMVVVGKEQEFKTPLATLGAVKPLDIAIKPPSSQVSKKDASTLAKGKELLAKAQQAVGGADKLAAIQDWTQVVDVAINTGQGSMKAKQVQEWIAPSVLKQTQELPFGKIVVYADGEGGWMVTPQGKMPMPPPVLAQVKTQIFRALPVLLLSDRKEGCVLNATGEAAVEVACGSDKAKLFLDAASGLPAKIEYQSMGPQGPATVVETYGNWKDVGNGVKLPGSTTIEQDGRKFADATVTEMKVNSGLKKEDLSKQP